MVIGMNRRWLWQSVTVAWRSSVLCYWWYNLLCKACCLLLGVSPNLILILHIVSRCLSTYGHYASTACRVKITLRLRSWHHICLIRLTNLCSRLLAYALVNWRWLLCHLYLFWERLLLRERWLLQKAAIQKLKRWISCKMRLVNVLRWRRISSHCSSC